MCKTKKPSVIAHSVVCVKCGNTLSSAVEGERCPMCHGELVRNTRVRIKKFMRKYAFGSRVEAWTSVGSGRGYEGFLSGMRFDGGKIPKAEPV